MEIKHIWQHLWLRQHPINKKKILKPHPYNKRIEYFQVERMGFIKLPTYYGA
jgi:hypothetical protein